MKEEDGWSRRLNIGFSQAAGAGGAVIRIARTSGVRGTVMIRVGGGRGMERIKTHTSGGRGRCLDGVVGVG